MPLSTAGLGAFERFKERGRKDYHVVFLSQGKIATHTSEKLETDGDGNLFSVFGEGMKTCSGSSIF